MITMINEGINRLGLAAAVANANAGSVATTATETATSKSSIPRTRELHAQNEPSSRVPSPPRSASNVTRIYGGSGRGGSVAGRGGRGGSSEDIRSRLLSRLGIYGTSPPHAGSGDRKVPMMQSQPLTAAQHRRVRILRGMGVGYNMVFQSPPDGSAMRKPLSGVVPSKEPLKFHADDDSNDDDECDDESIIVPDDSDDEIEITDEENGEDKLTRRDSGTSRTKTKRNKLKPKPTRIAFQDQVEVMPIPTRHEYSNRIKSRIWSNRYELQENAERNAVEFASEGWNWRNVTEDEGMYICSVSGELVHPAWVGGLSTVENGTSPTSAPNTAAEGAHMSATAPNVGTTDGAPIEGTNGL